MALIHSNFQIIKDRDRTLDTLLRTPMLSRTEAEHVTCYYLLRNIEFTIYTLFGVRLLPYQGIVIRMMLRKPYILNIMTRGGGKCIAGDSLCLTDNGFSYIKDLCHNFVGANEKEMNMFGENSFKKTSHTYVNPPERLYQLTTSNGYKLSGTFEHPIRVIENGELIWKKMGELSGSEYVVINRDNSYQFNGEFTGLSKDFGYIIGLLIGDGCFSIKKPSSIGFTSADSDIVDFVRENVSILDTKFYFTNTTSNIDFNIRCGSRKNKLEFLKRFGLTEALAGDKEIPKSILLSNKNVLAGFISGYFDSDGGVTGKGIEITSKSKKIINQLQTVLLSYGIISKLRMRKIKYKQEIRIYWTLIITGSAVEVFSKEIGFTCQRKEKLLDSFIKKNKPNTNKDLIRNCKLTLRELSACYNTYLLPRGVLRHLLSHYSINKYDYSYEKLGRILNETDVCKNDECYKKLKHLYDKKYYFDKISSISLTEEQTSYDVCIPNDHTFISNGFISHNTFLNAIYAALKGCISPGTKLLGVGSNRRQSRFIYNHINTIYNNKQQAALFREVVRKLADQPEESYIDICGSDSTKTSRLSFTPIANGDRIRGFRANVLLTDEANIISQEIYDTVLRPMLAVSMDPVVKVLQLQKEKELIAAGVLKPEDAVEHETNQVIMSSSAGYQFSFLYQKYKEYRDQILNAKQSSDPKVLKEASKYGVIQISYEAIESLSPGYLNIDSILADKRTFPSDRFLTEYGAQFASDSGGYIPRSLLESRQLPINSEPMVQRKAEQGSLYILAIDPSSGQNTDNDYFAIVVIKLDLATKTAYCVNASASAGKGWPYYVKLVRSYIREFNPVYIIMDSYGGGSQTKDLITHPDFLEKESGDRLLQTLDKDDLTTYCHAENKILRMNIPTNQFNEASNVHLKSMIEHKLFWFAAPASEESYRKEASLGADVAEANIDKLDDAMECIKLAKDQISLIISKQGANGLTTFGMPESLSTVRKNERMRKDLYSAMLLGAWGVKEYLQILETGPKQQDYNPVIVLA